MPTGATRVVFNGGKKLLRKSLWWPIPTSYYWWISILLEASYGFTHLRFGRPILNPSERKPRMDPYTFKSYFCKPFCLWAYVPTKFFKICDFFLSWTSLLYCSLSFGTQPPQPTPPNLWFQLQDFQEIGTCFGRLRFSSSDFGVFLRFFSLFRK